MEEVNLEVITSSQEIESSNKQVTELRRQLQGLEINVQAQLTMVSDARLHLSPPSPCRELQGQNRMDSMLGTLGQLCSGIPIIRSPGCL